MQVCDAWGQVEVRGMGVWCALQCANLTAYMMLAPPTSLNSVGS